MRAGRSLCALAAAALPLAACGRLEFDGLGVDAAPIAGDAPPLAADARPSCDPAEPFGRPVRFEGLAAPGVGLGTLRLLPDELSGYFWRGDGVGADIVYASRPSLTAPFVVEPVTGITSGENEYDPTISADGSLLVFRRSSPDDDLYGAVATSPRTFTDVAALSTVNTPASEVQPFLSALGTELVLASSRDMPGTGIGDLYISARTGPAFDPPVRITELATEFDEGDPVLGADGLRLYFRSDRPGGLGMRDIYVAQRAAVGQPFDAPVLVEGVSSAANDGPSWVSADDCRLYLTSGPANARGIYVATRGVP